MQTLSAKSRASGTSRKVERAAAESRPDVSVATCGCSEEAGRSTAAAIARDGSGKTYAGAASYASGGTRTLGRAAGGAADHVGDAAALEARDGPATEEGGEGGRGWAGGGGEEGE